MPHPQDCWENLQTEKTYYPGTTLMHSYGDHPAYVEYWLETYQDHHGRTSSRRQGVRCKKWFDRGKPANRSDLPTTIFYDKEGNITEEHWRNSNDQLDRPDGPAVIKYEPGKYFEMWYQKGVHHRKGKPAVVGSDGSEIWYDQGLISRTDGGPAVTMYLTIDGEQVCEKQWRVCGNAHRIDGAAIERSNGEEEYWVAGRQVNELQLMAIAAKIGDVDDAHEAYNIAHNTKFDSDQNLVTRHRGVNF